MNENEAQVFVAVGLREGRHGTNITEREVVRGKEEDSRYEQGRTVDHPANQIQSPIPVSGFPDLGLGLGSWILIWDVDPKC